MSRFTRGQSGGGLIGLDLSSPCNPRGDEPAWQYRVGAPKCPRRGDASPAKGLPAAGCAGFLACRDDTPVLDEEGRYAGRLAAGRARPNSRVTRSHLNHLSGSRAFISSSKRPYGFTCSQIGGVRALRSRGVSLPAHFGCTDVAGRGGIREGHRKDVRCPHRDDLPARRDPSLIRFPVPTPQPLTLLVPQMTPGDTTVESAPIWLDDQRLGTRWDRRPHRPHSRYTCDIHAT